MDLIDLETFRQSRQAVPLTRAANAFLATATEQNQAGVEKDLLLRAMTIALAKLVVECSEPGEASNIARSIGESLPRLVAHLERKEEPGN
ncbi:hypothetical protein [Arenibaculum pallidiluteum]|uniref:hypothetical protein n=1 Tax=Arenibaculum pallidiluteum TaxID=2812559 RepID=UPI001A970539|nr:hypothetical protein [Arenibaculum pallidiluteum]